MNRIVIFGAGKYADVAYFYFKNDSQYDIAAFAVDGAHLTNDTMQGRPVVPFEEVEARYPPSEYRMFVAVGYQDMNRLRARKFAEAKTKGYTLVSYVSSKASNFGGVAIGENTMVLEHAAIQPCCRIGNNVSIWSGNHIGHHATIEDHCYIAGQCMIAGSAVVEQYCFIGVNATISHEVRVGCESLIGAGALIFKDVPPKSVYIASETPRYRLDSANFLRMTKMKGGALSR